MSCPIEVRIGTPAEVAAATAEVRGLSLEPLIRVTFLGHLVHDPDQPDTLTPAVAAHKFASHPGIPPAVVDAMMPLLLRQLLNVLEAGR